MSNISAKDVKELREETGIGMMDCKKALTDANGDREQALKILKEKGLAVAAKRAGREIKEGRIVITIEGKKGFMLAVGCETDFVAKSDDFKNLVTKLQENFLAQGEAYIGSPEQESLVTEVSGKTGEKIQLSQSAIVESNDGLVEQYLHSNSKVGVLLDLSCPDNLSDNEEVRTFAKDITMQIAAMSPIAVTQDDISDTVKNDQKEVFMKQMADSGKPQEIIEKIVMGKLNKELAELCLMDMVFVKDSKLKIKDLLATLNKKVSADIKINTFKRMQIGS